MEECVIIVDNSNIWIEGKKHSARIKGISTPYHGKDPIDNDWRIDFGKLLEFTEEGKKIRKAILVGSKPPKNDSLWNAARKKGFEVEVEERNFQNKEKAVDTRLVANGVALIYSTTPAVLKILSGDTDFKPLIEHANNKNWETEIWAFSSALGAKEYLKSVNRVVELDSNIKDIEL